MVTMKEIKGVGKVPVVRHWFFQIGFVACFCLQRGQMECGFNELATLGWGYWTPYPFKPVVDKWKLLD